MRYFLMYTIGTPFRLIKENENQGRIIEESVKVCSPHVTKFFTEQKLEGGNNPLVMLTHEMIKFIDKEVLQKNADEFF